MCVRSESYIYSPTKKKAWFESATSHDKTFNAHSKNDMFDTL